MVEAAWVDRELVDTVWPKVKHLIGAAYATGLGDGSFEDTERQVLEHNAIIGVVVDGTEFLAAIVVQIWDRPRGKLCVILACGGKYLNRWKDFMALIEDYGRKQDCSCVRLYGRKGWKRIFPDFYEPWITLEKRL